MLEAVVVEEDGLQHGPVGALQDLRDGTCRETAGVSYRAALRTPLFFTKTQQSVTLSVFISDPSFSVCL